MSRFGEQRCCGVQTYSYIEDLQINADDDTVSFVFRDTATKRLMKTQGMIFELIVYYLMRESGKYDDVETGVKIAWDAEDILQEQQLLELLDRKGLSCFGYSEYVKARGEVIKKAIIGESESVKNEIDIIALSGMNPRWFPARHPTMIICSGYMRSERYRITSSQKVCWRSLRTIGIRAELRLWRE